MKDGGKKKCEGESEWVTERGRKKKENIGEKASQMWREKKKKRKEGEEKKEREKAKYLNRKKISFIPNFFRKLKTKKNKKG